MLLNIGTGVGQADPVLCKIVMARQIPYCVELLTQKQAELHENQATVLT